MREKMIRACGRRRAYALPVLPIRCYSSRVLPGTPSPKPTSSRLRRLGLGGGLVAVGAASWAALGDDPRRRAKLVVAVPLRLARNIAVASAMIADYSYSLWGLPEGSPDREVAKHEAHVRNANRLQDLCFRNGGIYIKLGQHVGQLDYLVPQEYVENMRRSMLNRCPVSTYKQVCDVFLAELGRLPHEMFSEFNPVPLASASLAQVHAARTHSGEKVAVKVQHMHLTDTAAADTATVDFIVNVVHWLFPAFDYRWLLAEMRESVPKELDFINEAKNSEQCVANFKRLSPHVARYIIVPKIYWQLSTSKVLTMEFMDGFGVTDVDAIKKSGVETSDVAKLISEVFAEMIFRHGFVHCDPHAANMLVQVAPFERKGLFGSRKQPQLVLLDHGLYKELDPQLRLHYAALWKALVLADEKGIKEHSVGCGAGEDLYILFAGVLTMRPWNRIVEKDINHLDLPNTPEGRDELQMYASQYLMELTELLRRLPRVLLLLLKTNDCLRAVDKALGAPINTFIITGRVSARAVAEMEMQGSLSLWSQLKSACDRLSVEVRLLTLQLAAWFLQAGNVFARLIGRT